MTTTYHAFINIQDDAHEKGQSHLLEIEAGKEYSFKQEVLQTMTQKINFFIPKCSACKNEMRFAEGEVIYGDKWYHNSCWKDIEKIMEFASQ
jgi:hypothetical protein